MYQLLWHAASFILPVFSLRFYRIAERKKISKALVFFFLFASVLSALFTTKAVRIVRELDEEINETLESGGFPEITILDGIASVDAPQPLVLVDQGGMLFALDTSGVYTDIDPERFKEGILLTRTELIVLDSIGERNSMQLIELNEVFQTNPIVIDEDFVLKAWSSVSRAGVVMAAIGLWIWHFFLRLIVLALVGLLIWGSISVLRSDKNFPAIMTTGFYAVVPALYLHYLISRAGFQLPGLQTMIIMFTWMGILLADLGRDLYMIEDQETALLRMTPIGVPMLLVLAWDVVFTPNIEMLALWGVPILTFIAWMVMTRFQTEDEVPPASLD